MIPAVMVWRRDDCDILLLLFSPRLDSSFKGHIVELLYCDIARNKMCNSKSRYPSDRKGKTFGMIMMAIAAVTESVRHCISSRFPHETSHTSTASERRMPPSLRSMSPIVEGMMMGWGDGRWRCARPPNRPKPPPTRSRMGRAGGPERRARLSSRPSEERFGKKSRGAESALGAWPKPGSLGSQHGEDGTTKGRMKMDRRRTSCMGWDGPGGE